MANTPVPDGPDVTGLRKASLEDVLDVLSRTNRGLLRVERTLHDLTTAIFTFLAIFFLTLFLKVRA